MKYFPDIGQETFISSKNVLDMASKMVYNRRVRWRRSMNISEELKQLGFKDLGYLAHPGIYILTYEGKVVYVGKTTNIMHRLSSPDHCARSYDHIYFVKCDINELDRLEALMILRFKPDKGKAYSFNNNTDVRNKPLGLSPQGARTIIPIGGREYTFRRRV
jgi:hypothetical protein